MIFKGIVRMINHTQHMGLFSFLAVATLFLFGQSNLYASAQNLTATPVDALSTSVFGQSFFLYNPESNLIVSPSTSNNALTLVDLDDYNNSTMQWNISRVATVTTERYITAANPEAAGCSGNAYLNPVKESVVKTACSPTTSVYTNLLFTPVTGTADTFYIAAASNAAGCVTIDGDTLNVPGTACTRSAGTQWQFVTISNYYY
jgi:hypothetical protein